MPNDLPFPYGVPPHQVAPPNTMPGAAGPPAPAAWTTARVTVPFNAVVGNTQLLFSGSWQTPIFDLQPQLGAFAQNTAGRSSQSPAAVSMWGGSMVHLAITSSQFAGFRVLAQEWAHPVDINALGAASDEQDITEAITNVGTTSSTAVLTYVPYARVRYYQLRLVFQILSGFAVVNPPVVTVQAAFY